MRPIPPWFERAIHFHRAGGCAQMGAIAMALVVAPLCLELVIAAAPSPGIPLDGARPLLDALSWLMPLGSLLAIVAVVLHALPFMVGPATRTHVSPWPPDEIRHLLSPQAQELWEAYTAGIATTTACLGSAAPLINAALFAHIQQPADLPAYAPACILHIHRFGLAIYPHDSKIHTNRGLTSPTTRRADQILVRANWHSGGWRQALATFTQGHLFAVTDTPLTAHQRLAAATMQL